MYQVVNISKKFRDRFLFEHLSLKFEPGKIYAITGKSGSGKSTLLNILGKIDKPDEGTIYFKQKPLDKISDLKFYRNYLGYLFQNFGLIENESVKENLKLGFVGKKLSCKEKIEIQEKALREVGLEYIQLNQKIYELSGGEAQRIALAKVIIKSPPIILADELTGSLDPQTSEEILKIILQLKNKDRIIIIATHQKEIWEACDEVISLDNLDRYRSIQVRK